MIRFDKTKSATLTGTQFIHEWVHYLTDNHNLNIIDASRGKPSLAIDSSVIEAMQNKLLDSKGEVFPYGKDALGEYEYRYSVAKNLSRFYNTKVLPSQVAFTPGGQFSLYCLFTILDKKKDGVFVTTNPSYLNYIELINYVKKDSDVKSNPILNINTSNKNNYKITAKILEENLKNNNRPINAFIFCNPVNPTGQVITSSEWIEIANVLSKYDAPIIMDEAFIEVVFDEENKCSLLHACPSIADRIILLRSGTKAQGLPGERLCVTILPNNLIEEFRFHQSRLLGNSPILAQVGMSKAIESLTENRISQISNYYKENATILTSALDNIIGKENYIMPQGGFFLLANFRKLLGKRMPTKAKELMHIDEIYIKNDKLLMTALITGFNNNVNDQIALVPSSFFGIDEKEGFMRISFSIDRNELNELIKRIKSIFSSF